MPTKPAPDAPSTGSLKMRARRHLYSADLTPAGARERAERVPRGAGFRAPDAATAERLAAEGAAERL